mgnify:FL=1
MRESFRIHALDILHCCAIISAYIFCVNMKIAVYTSIIGDFDELKTQPVQSVNCDFICFTDNDNVKSDFWRVVHTDFVGNTSRFKAKYPKCFPHQLLWDYDITYWIDGSVLLKKNSTLEELIQLMGQNENLYFKHPDRDCIYDECEVSMNMPKYKGHSLREQVSKYKKAGYPEHNGLVACTTILRKNTMNNRTLNEAWYNEMSDDLIQDQLSLPYVSWKAGVKINAVDINLWNNEYVLFGSHKNGRQD